MLKKFSASRGDTLIEVLFAVSVFSLVAVSALTIMNQGTAISQRALETTLVRQEMSAQADTLRFLHDSYIAAYQPGQTYDASATPTTPAQEWQAMLESIKNNAVTVASAFDEQATCPNPPSHAFIMDSRNAKFVNAPSKMVTASSFSQLTYTTSSGVQVLDQAQGIWVEAVRSAPNTSDTYQANVGYIDFHIRSCWVGPGQALPITLGTIVRLYEPR